MLTAPRVVAFTLTTILASMYYSDAHRDVEVMDTWQKKRIADINRLLEHII